MEKNGGTLKVLTRKTDGFIEVCFQDKGVGIKKEDFRKLFTPFFTTKAQGMGVGLAICKRFIELHGGSITVESEEGEGSTFTVILPIQRNGVLNYSSQTQTKTHLRKLLFLPGWSHPPY